MPCQDETAYREELWAAVHIAKAWTVPGLAWSRQLILSSTALRYSCMETNQGFPSQPLMWCPAGCTSSCFPGLGLWGLGFLSGDKGYNVVPFSSSLDLGLPATHKKWKWFLPWFFCLSRECSIPVTRPTDEKRGRSTGNVVWLVKWLLSILGLGHCTHWVWGGRRGQTCFWCQYLHWDVEAESSRTSLATYQVLGQTQKEK